jgi:hypothetical protein
VVQKIEDTGRIRLSVPVNTNMQQPTENKFVHRFVIEGKKQQFEE